MRIGRVKPRLDRVGVGLGPDLNEAVQGAVWDQIFVVENLHRGGAGVISGVEPPLDAGAVVGDARAEADRRFHEVKRYWTSEESRDCNVQILFLLHHFAELFGIGVGF